MLLQFRSGNFGYAFDENDTIRNNALHSQAIRINRLNVFLDKAVVIGCQGVINKKLNQPIVYRSEMPYMAAITAKIFK